MKLVISKTGRKLNVKQIESLERQVGFKLPKDYRKFLRLHNGGTPNKTYFKIRPDDDYKVWIDSFHSVDENLVTPCEKSGTETISLTHHVFGELVPDDCLIIGMVMGSELLLLRLGEGKQCGILVKSLSNLGPPTIDNKNWKDKEKEVYWIAKSFSDFLNLLSEDDGDSE